MWKQCLRRFSALETRTVPTVTNLKLLTNGQLLALAEQISKVKTEKVADQGEMGQLLSVLGTRTARMAREELVFLMKTTAHTQIFEQVTSQAAFHLTAQAPLLTYEECVDLAKALARKGNSSSTITALLEAISKEITEVDESELFSKPMHTFESLLKAFSLTQCGNGDFYKSIADIILMPSNLQTISTSQLIRAGLYMRRSSKTAGRGGFGIYSAIEQRVWTDLHQYRLTSLPPLLRVFGDLIPANLCSNKLHLLLEFALFQQLAKEETRITTAQLVQLLVDSGNYVFKYKPLFLILQRLLIDAMDRLKLKEVVKVFWALGKNKKECRDIMETLLRKARFLLESEQGNLRSFTFLLNGCLNAGMMDAELVNFLFEKLRLYEMKPDDVHYWVKSVGILSAGGLRNEEMISSVLDLILKPGTEVRGTDVVRLLGVALLMPRVVVSRLPALERLLTRTIPDLPDSYLARLTYIVGRLPGVNLSIYSLLETSLSGRNLMSLKPSDLAVASFSLADLNRVGFFPLSIPALKHYFDVLRHRVVEVGSDSESETEESVVREEEIRFGTQWEMTASALTEMCWTLVAADHHKKGFWSEKAISCLQSIALNAENRPEMNHWKTTAKALEGADIYFSTVDSMHFSMILNVLAVLKGVEIAQISLQRYPGVRDTYREDEVLETDPNFLTEVSAYCKSAGFPIISERGFDGLLNRIDLLLPNQVCVLCYSPHHYLSGELRSYFKFKHQILTLQGFKVVPVSQVVWKAADPEAKSRLFSVA